jgi:lysozyme
MKTILTMLFIIIALLSCNPTYADSTSKMMKYEEGFRSSPYLGTNGYIHIGYGYKIHEDKGLDPRSFSISISEEVASLMLDSKLTEIKSKLSQGRHGKIFKEQTRARQDVLVSMAYQMGYGGLMSFKLMWGALEIGNMELAAVEALDSLWADQTPQRAHRHAFTLILGISYEY